VQPGLWRRFVFACRAFFALLFEGRLPADIVRAVATDGRSADRSATPAAPAPTPVTPAAATAAAADRAVQILAVLQRDGRLIDFLTEDIASYPDDQVGAAVRDIHLSCRTSLQQYVKLEPVLDADEGASVTIPAGFDPAAIKLVGNVARRPPLRGVVRHRGWRALEVTLPGLPEGEARSIVAAAEVEVA
jgi:hypothetical protein